jgi:hypothetical protein
MSNALPGRPTPTWETRTPAGRLGGTPTLDSPPMLPSPAPLRIVHTGCAGLRLEIGGAVLAVDPATDPGPVDTILVTWNEAERLQGALEAVRSGRLPRVAASPELLDWLAARGAFEAADLDDHHAGVRVEARTYRPVPYATSVEAAYKLGSAVKGPLRATRRLATRARLPTARPRVLRLTLPDGRRLVHLNCALHRDTPQTWLDELSAAWGGADWLLASWDHGEGGAFAERIAAFGARHLLLTDLVGDVRRDLGVPTETRSPLADRLAARGLPVKLLAARTSLRFAAPGVTRGS